MLEFNPRNLWAELSEIYLQIGIKHQGTRNEIEIQILTLLVSRFSYLDSHFV